MAAKRIAVLASFPLHPFRAGNSTRVRRLVDDLRELGHEVHFLFIDDVAGDVETMRVALDGRLHVLRNERPPFANPWRLRPVEWLARLRGKRLAAQLLTDPDVFVSEALRRDVRAAAHRIDPDVAIVAYPFYGSLLREFPARTSKVLDTLDLFTDRHWTMWRNGLDSRFVSMTAAAEGRALANADLVLAIQEEEARAFRRLTDRPVETLGHRVEIRPLPLRDASQPPRIGYLGGRGGYNQWRIERFAREVLPGLRRRVPDLELWIGGVLGDVPHLADLPGARCVGGTDDLSKFFEQIDVFVNPAPAGRGLHVKNLEALASGCPTVMCEAAARGIRDGIGSAFLVGRRPKDLADPILRVLEDRALAARLSEAATNFMTRYDAGVSERLEALFGRA